MYSVRSSKSFLVGNRHVEIIGSSEENNHANIRNLVIIIYRRRHVTELQDAFNFGLSENVQSLLQMDKYFMLTSKCIALFLN